MGAATGSAGPDKGSHRYSAKAEIDDFMRRFLAYAKTENAAARAAPTRILLRDGALTSSDLKTALDRLDLLRAQRETETTNLVQFEIQNEALQSLHRDRMRRHADELRVLDDARRTAEALCATLSGRLRIAETLTPGRRLSAAKQARLLKRDRRPPRRPLRASRVTEAAPKPNPALIAAE